jgi:hypothetical protein
LRCSHHRRRIDRVVAGTAVDEQLVGGILMHDAGGGTVMPMPPLNLINLQSWLGIHRRLVTPANSLLLVDIVAAGLIVIVKFSVMVPRSRRRREDRSADGQGARGNSERSADFRFHGSHPLLANCRSRHEHRVYRTTLSMAVFWTNEAAVSRSAR